MQSYPFMKLLNADPKRLDDRIEQDKLYRAYKLRLPIRSLVPSQPLVELRGQLLRFCFDVGQGKTNEEFINFLLEIFHKNCGGITYHDGGIRFKDNSNRLFEAICFDVALVIIESGLPLLGYLTNCSYCGKFFLPERSHARYCSDSCRGSYHTTEIRKKRRRLKERKNATAEG